MAHAALSPLLARARGRLAKSVGMVHSGRGTFFWAGVVGLVGALVGAAFPWASGSLFDLATGQSGGLAAGAAHLGPLRRLLVPTFGGLVAGSLLALGRRFAPRGASRGEFMEAIILDDGEMPVRHTLVRCASSLVSIASGGSIGREGPMVQLAALAASRLGRLVGVPAPRLRLWVACGVAAAIASAYRAPIAGALFVAEIVMGTLRMQSFGPLVLSALVASWTSRQIWGAQPLYPVGVAEVGSALNFLPFFALSLVAGALAPGFLRGLRHSEGLFAALGLPLPLRLAVGGLAVGLISCVVPEVWGNGYVELLSLLHQRWALGTLAGFLACKLLATYLSVGSGAVGGVFTPTLLLGGGMGLIEWHLCHHMWPTWTASPQLFALVGMGSFLAAITHAPLMAMLLMLEYTLDHDVVMPLMLACTVAHALAASLDGRSVYTEQLARRTSRPAALSAGGHVRDLCDPKAPRTLPGQRLEEVAGALRAGGDDVAFVVDARGTYLGSLYACALPPGPLGEAATVGALPPPRGPTLSPEASLAAAAGAFIEVPFSAIAVVDEVSGRFLGSVARADLLLCLGQRLT